MANQSYGVMNLILPTKNKNKFLNLLSYDNNGEEEYICAWADDFREENNKNGFTYLSIDFWCKWSVYSSLIDDGKDSYSKSDENSLSLLEALKKYEVERIDIYAEEPGIGFCETVSYEKGNESIESIEHELIDREAKSYEYETLIDNYKSSSKDNEMEME